MSDNDARKRETLSFDPKAVREAHRKASQTGSYSLPDRQPAITSALERIRRVAKRSEESEDA